MALPGQETAVMSPRLRQFVLNRANELMITRPRLAKLLGITLFRLNAVMRGTANLPYNFARKAADALMTCEPYIDDLQGENRI